MSTSENTARRVDEVDAEDTAATTSAWVPQDRVMNDSTLPPATQQPILSSETTTSSAPRTKNSMTGRPPTKKVGRFGLADWTRLLASSTDLAQRKGQPVRKKIAWKEIRQHRHVYDGWTVIKGKVYNISPYLAYHPGGEFILRLVLGKDATSLFDRYHRWVNEDALVGQLLIGYLDTSPTSEEDDSNDETKPSSSYLLGAIKSNNATTTASTASSSTQTGTVQTTRQTNNDTDEFPMPAPRLAAAVSALSVGSKDDSSKP